jgi:hypothetical protein
MVFFVSDGMLLWIAPDDRHRGRHAQVCFATLDAELFPTEVRSTSNGFLLVAAVADPPPGSCSRHSYATGRTGPAIAWRAGDDPRRHLRVRP